MSPRALWRRWRAFKTRELIDELNSQHDDDMGSTTAAPGLGRAVMRRSSWQDLTLRPAHTEWKGD